MCVGRQDLLAMKTPIPTARCRSWHLGVLVSGLSVFLGVGLAAAVVQDTLSRHVAVPGGGELHIGVVPRTPEQVAAFYEARHFPPDAVAALARVCLLTVTIHNRSQTVVWLEPARWRLRAQEGGEVRRLDRAHWTALWERIGLPAAQRATFGWTQLPETRDLRPGEPVGGNVVVEPPAGPFSLEARFTTGADRRGPPIVARFDHLRCPAGRTGEGKP